MGFRIARKRNALQRARVLGFARKELFWEHGSARKKPGCVSGLLAKNCKGIRDCSQRAVMEIGIARKKLQRVSGLLAKSWCGVGIAHEERKEIMVWTACMEESCVRGTCD